MSTSTYDLINTALITGGAGGIGRGLAENLIKANKKVLLAGRTESTLKQTAAEIGASGFYVLDTGSTTSIPAFVKRITSEHPDLNCVINNAGVQRPFEFPGSNFMNGDYDFDLAKADQEIDINIRGPMHLCVQLLPHLTSLPQGTGVIMNVSSVLGFMPISLINPVYNGTKAWLHFFTTNLRTQMGKNRSDVKVIEIVPPAVTTDLHRERTDPHDNSKEKNKMALSLEEFVAEVEDGWKKGLDTVTAGPGHKIVEAWEGSIGDMYRGQVKSRGG